MATTRTTRWVALGLAVAAAGVLAATMVSRTGTREVTIPAGTRIVGELQQTISTKGNTPGDRVEIKVSDPIELYDGATLPAGVLVRGVVTHAKGGGRIAGSPELTIRFRQISVDGNEYDVATEPFRVSGKSDAKESALEIGGGAVAGGVIGAIAGDVVKGALIGAVIGTGVAVATDGDDITLRSGQRMQVTLQEPVTVRYKPVAAEKKP